LKIRGYFKTDGSSRGSCEIIPKIKLGKTSDTPPELSPIYTKPSDAKKLSDAPPELPDSLT
jgi:hypothetical protein